jgi:hypothetical protein
MKDWYIPGEPTTCTNAEPPSLTLDVLAETMRVLEESRPRIAYCANKFIPVEMIDQDTGERTTLILMQGALRGKRDLVLFNPVHETEFIEACRQEGIVAVPVNWDTDFPIDECLRSILTST